MIAQAIVQRSVIKKIESESDICIQDGGNGRKVTERNRTNNSLNKTKPRTFLLGKTGGGIHINCTKVFGYLISMDEHGVIRDIWKV